MLCKTDGKRTWVERNGQWALRTTEESIMLGSIHWVDGFIYYTDGIEEDEVIELTEDDLMDWEEWENTPTVVEEYQTMAELVFG